MLLVVLNQKNNNNPMKSSMTQESHNEKVISHARFQMTIENQIINR
jgi:hypothetical protein